MVTRRSPTSSSDCDPKLLSDMLGSLPAAPSLPHSRRRRSVLGRHLVGRDVHLGDVGLDLDLAGLVAERRSQLVTAGLARAVEALAVGGAAAGAGDVEEVHRR